MKALAGIVATTTVAGTGEKVRKLTAETPDDLTAQERQIALGSHVNAVV